MNLSEKVVGISGLGLIGGSFAAAMKKYLPDTRVIGYDINPQEAENALSHSLVDKIENTFNELAKTVDILILASNISSVLGHIKALHSYSKSMIVSDVCSVKRPVMKAAETFSGNITFVGGHPMTGSEKTGNEHANADLFQNSLYVLSPPPTGQIPKEMVKIIESVGAHPVVLPPDLHDKAVSQVSHLPQLMAVALLNEVLRNGGDTSAAFRLAAGGFRDMTRIGESSFSVWKDILRNNSDNIYADLNSLIDRLIGYKEAVKRGDLETIGDEFRNARETRKRIK